MEASSNFNIKQTVPFFMVTDMEKSLSFYTHGLGLSIKNTWTPVDKIEWCWLEREGLALMLQEYRSGSVNVNAIKGTGVSLCFMCDDALALFEEFKAKGIAVDEPFVGNAAWDVQIIDPDGYQLHFESPTDVPEEIRYYDWVNNRARP